MHKAIALSAAVEKIPDRASVMIGGFLGVGSPHRIIAELVRQGRKCLTVIANDTARPGIGIARPVVTSGRAANPTIINTCSAPYVIPNFSEKCRAEFDNLRAKQFLT